MMLWCAAVDRTFEQVLVDGEPALRGKCIHCNAALLLSPRGKALGKASLEHIVPQGQGGQDVLENLALACKRCNNLKGSRLDRRPLSDPTLAAVIETLTERRAARHRPPPESWALPPFPAPQPPQPTTEPEPELKPRRGRKGRKRKGRR